jgi:hypothetical protein
VAYSYNFSGKSESSEPVDQSATSTGIYDELKPDDVLLWPGPAGDKVYIRLNITNGDPIFIKLFSSDGKFPDSRECRVNGIKPGYQQVEISTADLMPGVYFMHVLIGNRLGVKKNRQAVIL